jgi:hypothetical protein
MVLRVELSRDTDSPNPITDREWGCKFWVKPTNRLIGFGEKPPQEASFYVQFLQRTESGLALSDYNVGDGLAYGEPLNEAEAVNFVEGVKEAVKTFNQWVEGDVWFFSIDTEENSDCVGGFYGLAYVEMSEHINWDSYGINSELGEQLLALAAENESEILAFTEGESYPSLLMGNTKVFRLVEGNWEAYN